MNIWLTLILIVHVITALGIIGLLAYIVYLLIGKQGPVKTISDNHLSGLPSMAVALARIEAVLVEIRDSINILRERR